MFTPTSEQIAAALEHAASCAPLEACGIIAGGSFLATRNLASERGHFIMDRGPLCRLDASTGIEAIVHSHIEYPAVAGEADRAACEAGSWPWLIVSWPSGGWTVIEPEGWQAPLVGREWQWGSHDCFGLIRDGFHAYTGILVPDYPRDWLFWRRGENSIAERVKEAGFVILPPGTKHQHCDVIGMRIASDVVNHLALFLEPDIILHQLYRRLSVRELYGGMWFEQTMLHLRHERFL